MGCVSRLHPIGSTLILVRIICLLTVSTMSSFQSGLAIDPPKEGCIRIATFNMALNRKEIGQLSRDLERGDAQAEKIAAIVQWVRPDILLANEVDFDNSRSATLLRSKYLNVGKLLGTEARNLFDFQYANEVNTGVPSGLDLNGNGRTTDPEDAWGFGAFPGQYGMAVFSRFPIVANKARTFQHFLWKDMPNALQPGTGDKSVGNWKLYYSESVWNQLRLSSKSHWDVPIQVGDSVLHVIASHPTPPVFDGPEDRNGCRNNDEIRLLQDYIEGKDYMVDDQGVRGGLSSVKRFVILGDLNSDPTDGNGNITGITNLLASARVNASFRPSSKGAVEAAEKQGNANRSHRADPAYDTGDFNDREPGNLRVDFVIPSKELQVVGGGVFWPTEAELRASKIDISEASDHHLVWLDIQFP